LLALLTAQVDPKGSLPDDERERRVAQARKAHFARLALASAKARRARTSLTSQIEADRELAALRRALVAAS
jgi:hypothetical protein